MRGGCAILESSTERRAGRSVHSALCLPIQHISEKVSTCRQRSRKQRRQQRPLRSSFWEEVPENTKLFLIPNTEAEKYRKVLASCHNNYLGNQLEEDEDLFTICALVAAKVEYLSEEHKDIAALWHKYLVTGDKDIVGPITRVYLTGVIL